MAQGWARALRPDLEAISAGTHPQPLNRLAVRAMAETGIDISANQPKTLDAIHPPPDVVVTVCDAADAECPVIPGVRVLHAPFDDPPALACGARDDDDAMPHYRRVRDEIRGFVVSLKLPFTKETLMTNPSSSTTKASCCGPDCCTSEPSLAAGDSIRQQVRESYSTIARAGSWSVASSCGTSPAGGGCCGPATFTPDQLASAIGYSQTELGGTPDGANMGLSCGNPTALASLAPGEVVLDLGSGGGFDCFIAGAKVGPSGSVIGVDMTPDMITKARANTATYTSRTGLANVQFRLGEIESLPVGDRSVDVVISNCVLNLSPDKPRVWREIARVLKPGGRVAVSDLALLRPLPEAIRGDIEALVGCIAGAVLIEDTRAQMAAAGFTRIELKQKPQYIEALTMWEDPLVKKILAALPVGDSPADYITSLDISASIP